MSVIKKKSLCRSYSQYHKYKGKTIKRKPLSMKELREREDLWVWVVPINGADFEPEWYYIYDTELRNRYYRAYLSLADHTNYGKRWLAYDIPPDRKIPTKFPR